MPRNLFFSLLSAFGLVIVCTLGLMVFFSSRAVQREFNNLPPEVQQQFESRAKERERTEILCQDSDIAAITHPEVWELLCNRSKRVLRGNPLERARQNALWALAFSATSALALGFVLAWYWARRIARPILAVSEAAVKVAEGNLNARAAEIPAEQEVQQLARNFNQMTATLARLEEERTHLIADIAHELRTPLTVLQARLDALEDGLVPLSTQEIGSISKQTELLTRLVNDLRILSSADAQRLSLYVQPLSISELFDHVQDSFSTRFADYDVQVSIAPHLPTLLLDHDRMVQVLSNLLDNALRHTPAGKSITLAAFTRENSVCIVVSDEGEGVAPEHVHKIFDRFYRVEGSRGREGGGSGLGLAIVRVLVEAQGGTVHAKNLVSGGLSIHICFTVQ